MADMSASEAEDRNAYLTLGRLCVLRDRGDTEEKIAKQLGFSNVGDFHQQLRDWELPDWIVGQDSAASSTERKDRTKSRSRSRTLGPSRELPPASNATPLFRERLEALLEDAELLKHMDEDLRGKYFVRTDIDTTPVYFSREHVSEEVWEMIREQHDLDPDDTDFFATDARNKMPGGVAKSPSEALSILISVYALAGGRMDLLLDALHRDPPPAESEVWDEIRVCIEGSKANNDKRDGLKVLARHLATWVRGSEVGPGKPSKLSKADHGFACRITHYREHGLTDEEIARRESHRKKEDGTGYSLKDITELGDLGLTWS
jgi:hypothetical protein